MDGLVEDLKNFLDALGMDKVHFVGESLGGFLGYHLAHRYPERLKTLTLVCTPSPSFRHHPYGVKGTMDGMYPGGWGADEKKKAQLLEEFGTEHRELAEWVDSETWKSPVDGTYGFFKAATNCEVDVETFLSEINVPTLSMIGADHTRIITSQEAQRLCDLMPNARLVTFPGIKAQCQFVIPEKCAQEVVRFIKGEKKSALQAN